MQENRRHRVVEALRLDLFRTGFKRDFGTLISRAAQYKGVDFPSPTRIERHIDQLHRARA